MTQGSVETTEGKRVILRAVWKSRSLPARESDMKQHVNVDVQIRKLESGYMRDEYLRFLNEIFTTISRQIVGKTIDSFTISVMLETSNKNFQAALEFCDNPKERKLVGGWNCYLIERKDA